MTGFKWETEEEAWDAEPPERPRPSRPERRWLRLLLLIIVVAGSAVLLVRRTESHLATTDERLQNEIIAAHTLIRNAAAEGDAELVRAYLSGRDPGWSRSTLETIVADERFSYGALGLERVTPPAGEVVDVIIAPDLLEATVVTRHDYRERGSKLGSATISLEQKTLYRRGADRWLWAPLEGEVTRANIDYIDSRFSIDCPASDNDFCFDLGEAVSRHLDRYCSENPDACRQQLYVYMDTAVGSVTELYRPRNLFDDTGRLRLPAPSLIGEPVDTDAYFALIDGYRMLLFIPFMRQKVDYACCHHTLFFQAFREWELSRLHYQMWPLDSDHYAQLYDAGIMLPDIIGPWLAAPATVPASPEAQDDVLAIYALAEFLLTLPEVDERVLIRELAQTNNYWDWLQAAIGPTLTPDSEIEFAWRQFLARRLNANAGTPPIPLPDQSLLALCVSDDGQQGSIQRYDGDDAGWEALLSLGSAFAYLTPLPEDRSVMWPEITLPTDGYITLTRWQQTGDVEHLRAPREDDTQFGGYYGVFDPSGRYMALYQLDARFQAIQIQLMDTSACIEDVCPAWNVAGAPTWSPNGRHTLLREGQSFAPRAASIFDQRLWLADATGRNPQSLGATPPFGAAPFWRDSDTFGYLTATGDIVSAHRQTPFELTTLLDGRRLADALPRLESFAELNRADILLPPGDPDVLYIRLVRRNRLQFILEFDVRADRLTPLLETPVYTAGLQFSADGRYLTTAESTNRPGGRNRLYLLDRQSGQRHVFSVFGNFPGRGFDWSQDGQWLAILDDGSVEIVAPTHDFRHIVFHDFQRCNSIAWVHNAIE